jgi:hypothetical protein
MGGVLLSDRMQTSQKTFSSTLIATLDVSNAPVWRPLDCEVPRAFLVASHLVLMHGRREPDLVLAVNPPVSS